MTRYTNLKYIEWKSAEEMHEDSRKWYSELEFMNTEIHFLEELLGVYFIKPSMVEKYIQGKELVKRLSDYKKQIPFYIKKVQNHLNELIVLVDGIDQPYEEREVKTNHRKTQKNVEELFLDFKTLKKEIIHTVSHIMKETNRKYLIGGKYKK
ncbi:hypothetical protein [Sinomicrobium sp. M5D2P9]